MRKHVYSLDDINQIQTSINCGNGLNGNYQYDNQHMNQLKNDMFNNGQVSNNQGQFNNQYYNEENDNGQYNNEGQYYGDEFNNEQFNNGQYNNDQFVNNQYCEDYNNLYLKTIEISLYCIYYKSNIKRQWVIEALKIYWYFYYNKF